MKSKNKFYVTTAIDYVNAEPHIGHAYQKIIADVLARWNKLNGKEVFFLTGTDEHGQKIFQTAQKEGKTSKQFVDEIAVKFENAWKVLNIDFDKFIRTTDKDHEKKVQEIVKIMQKKGDLFRGKYSGTYCSGCEAYVTEKDLVNGRCPFHLNKEIEEIEEEAYFFRLSKYQEKLLDFYKKNPNYILPEFRRQEIINRVKEGLKDLNITRNKENLSWGIPFPLDDDFVIYVWYEALLNYITGIDWPNAKFKKFWPADVELLGIDNGWFHCVIWPAMLMSLGIKPAKTILINGFLTFNGQKISKSLGNTISPISLVNKYSADSIRYYVCRNFVFGQDGDFSEVALVDRHNNELANKLGNLVSRVSALVEKNGLQKTENKLLKKLKLKKIEKLLDNYEFDKALNEIFAFIDICNEYVQSKKPWETGNKKILYELADSIKAIAILLWPFIPSTSEKIAKQFGFKLEYNGIKKPLLENNKIKKGEILFEKIAEKK
jgi:methionyl-tRNA synthetase